MKTIHLKARDDRKGVAECGESLLVADYLVDTPHPMNMRAYGPPCSECFSKRAARGDRWANATLVIAGSNA